MARNIYEQLNTEQKQKETTLFPGMQQITSESQHMSGEKENSTSMIYNHHGLHSIRTVDDKLKSTAAAMAAKLAASTSSAEMLSSLLSTLASEGVIGHQNRENHSVDNLKRIKLDNGMPSFMSNHSQFSQPELLMKMMPPPHKQSVSHSSSSMLPLERPMSLPPLHLNQLTQAAGSTLSASYSYSSTTTLPPIYHTSETPSFPVSSSSYQNIQMTKEGGSSYSVPPISYQNIQVNEEGGPFLGQAQPSSSISH